MLLFYFFWFFCFVCDFKVLPEEKIPENEKSEAGKIESKNNSNSQITVDSTNKQPNNGNMGTKKPMLENTVNEIANNDNTAINKTEVKEQTEDKDKDTQKSESIKIITNNKIEGNNNNNDNVSENKPSNLKKAGINDRKRKRSQGIDEDRDNFSNNNLNNNNNMTADNSKNFEKQKKQQLTKNDSTNANVKNNKNKKNHKSMTNDPLGVLLQQAKEQQIIKSTNINKAQNELLKEPPLKTRKIGKPTLFVHIYNIYTYVYMLCYFC